MTFKRGDVVKRPLGIQGFCDTAQNVIDQFRYRVEHVDLVVGKLYTVIIEAPPAWEASIGKPLADKIVRFVSAQDGLDRLLDKL